MAVGDTNGGHVTRAELTAHIKGIDEHFDHIEDDFVYIKSLIQDIRDEMRDRREARSALRVNFTTAVIAAGIAGAFTLSSAFLH